MSDRPMGTGVSWSLRKDFKDYVLPRGEWVVLKVGRQLIDTDRPTARLLAKRINECLDATAKK